MTDLPTNEIPSSRKHKKIWRIVIENIIALILLCVLYYTGMFKEYFMQPDTTSCLELFQTSDMKIRSMKFFDSCNILRTFGLYNTLINRQKP